MYCVRIMYPALPGTTFDYDYYLANHVALGVGLLKKHGGVSPVRVEVDIHPFGLPDGKVPNHAINSLYFTTREEAEGFIKLFGIEEPVEEMKRDWGRYTSSPPEFMISEVIDMVPATGRMR